jgi:hypothetical protein
MEALMICPVSDFSPFLFSLAHIDQTPGALDTNAERCADLA